MTDREKAIKGLECCTHGVAQCPICPYDPRNNALPVDCMTDLAKDALELLKALEPRVLTLEEVEMAEFCMEPVFVEMLDENGKPQETPDLFSWRFVRHIIPLTGGKIYVLNNIRFSSALYEETYGTTWRCWISRPTDAQREAVKWDE